MHVFQFKDNMSLLFACLIGKPDDSLESININLSWKQHFKTNMNTKSSISKNMRFKLDSVF